jgi:hypothetical protein
LLDFAAVPDPSRPDQYRTIRRGERAIYDNKWGASDARRCRTARRSTIRVPCRAYEACCYSSSAERAQRSAHVVTALSEHIRQFPVTNLDGLLFTDEDGEAVRRTAFSREVWRPTIAKVSEAPAATGMHDSYW